MADWLRSRLTSESGSILVGSVAFAFVITFLGMALFDLAVVESRLATDRETRGQAFYTAESGLQMAWYKMAKDTPTFATVYAGTFLPGTTIFSGNVSGLGYSVTKVDSPTVSSPTTPLCGTTHCLRVQSTGHGPASVGYPGGNQAVIQAVFSASAPIFDFGAFGKDSILMKTSTLIDSYNPAVGCTPVAPATACAYSDSGASKNTLSKLDKLAGSNGDITNDANTGSADGIHGNALASGTYSGSGYILGTPPCAAAGCGGISGAPTKDLQPVPVCGPPYSAAGTFTNSGASYNAGTGVLDMSAGNTVTLNRGTTYCFSSFTMRGGTLQLSSTGTGAVVVNLTGLMDIKAGTVLNSSLDPAMLQFYSSATCTGACMNFSAGGESYATVYAPNADVRLSGSALVNGAIVGDHVQLDGSAELHYDEALRDATLALGAWGLGYWSLVSN